MGGFGSKNAGNLIEEAVAKPRSDPEPRPQALCASFDPETQTVTLPGSTASAQSSQAPRPKQPPPSSLHVNSRLISETLASANEWDGGGAAGSSGVALAEEEDLQAAIGRRPPPSQAYPSGGGHICHAGASGDSRPPLNIGGSNLVGGPAQSQNTGEKEAAVPSKKAGHSQPPLAAGLGLGLPGGCAWVDNSDFNKPQAADKSGQAPRSASVGTKPQGKGASSRSGIVSLPRIGQTISADQQSMVKELDKILTATPGEDQAERPRQKRVQAHNAASSSGGSAEVRSIMEDLDAPIISRGPRGGSAERDANERFNDRFASCSAGSSATDASAAPASYESPFRSDHRQRPGASIGLRDFD